MSVTRTAQAQYTRVSVPGPLPEHRCWAKAIRDVDHDARGGYAFDGVFLDRGAVYRLQTGMFVVTCERPRGERPPVTVTLWRVNPDAPDGLDLVKSWTHKSGRIGPRIIKGVATRLHKEDPPRAIPAVDGNALVDPPPRRPNQRWDVCRRCRQKVAPGDGYLVRKISDNGRPYTRVEHDECPPRRNEYPGRCHQCSGWVDAREGILVSVPLPYSTHTQLRPQHHPSCPPVPAKPPIPPPEPNPRPGKCEVCWQHVPAGKGEVIGPYGSRRLVHKGQCPTNPYNPSDAPTWILGAEATAAYDYPVGTVARVTLPDGPAEGPGWRAPLGDSDEVSVIGVVIAIGHNYVTHEAGRYRDGLISVWRVATEEEAAPVLDGEAARLELAGLTGRARRLLALYPGAAPADACAPPEHELEDLSLVSLPRVPVPLGAARPETTIHIDEQAGLVWTVVHNSADGDDWSLSNWGGSIAYRHPLTEERRRLIADLRDITGDHDDPG